MGIGVGVGELIGLFEAGGIGVGDGAGTEEGEVSGGVGVGETERAKGAGVGLLFLAERTEIPPTAMSITVSASKLLDKNSFV